MGITVQPLASGSLAGVLEITPDRFGDDRGYFIETYNRERLRNHGIELDFVQDNQSLSRDMGTLRGLHLQSPAFCSFPHLGTYSSHGHFFGATSSSGKMV